MKRIAGIDFGQARIGVALSDPSKILASPVHTQCNKKDTNLAIKELLAFLSPYSIEEIVIGMPYQLNGTVGQSADAVLQFITLLKEQTEIPIKTWDERLTTQQTERVMKKAKVSRKKRTHVIDAACATLILQSYLDQKQFSLLPNL
ncbi:MAG: putative pre-16S rRNA nuclease [Chlamydiae bacterium]|nr:putative pre-16S rRNA nuclease [Chlamydiota bacterium]